MVNNFPVIAAVLIAAWGFKVRWWVSLLLALVITGLQWRGAYHYDDEFVLRHLHLLVATNVMAALLTHGLVRGIQALWRRLTKQPTIETPPPA